jgi:uncharacterized protein YraI
MIAFAVLVGALPLTAYANQAFTLRDVEVYTGPGSEYPPVTTLPPNASVDVAGCLSDWSWCDVIFADSRGWVYAGDLGYPYENRRVAIIEIGPRIHVFPVVAFSLPAYWDAHYRSRPWYRERDVWVNRVQVRVEHGGRPPEGRPASAAPAAPPSASVTPPQGQAPQERASQGQAPQAGREPQYTQPRQPPETAQRPMQPQAAQPPAAQQQQAAPSVQSGRPPEARPPEARPLEGRPSAGRPPEAKGPEPQGPREAGPPGDRGQREGQGPQGDRGQREGQGPQGDRGQREGQGPQGRGGDNGPDRDRQ